MSQTLTAVKLTPGVTYCSSTTGNPYRADWSGIVHVLASEAAEIATKASGHTATAAEVGTSHHAGASLSITVG